jgi:hypothetical protein
MNAPRSAMQIALLLLVLSGITLVGWSVWQQDTTLAQFVVIGAVAAAAWMERTSSVERSGLWQGGFYFVSGAGLGMLAYHGEVSILMAALWLALGFWIERQMRDDVDEALDAFWS